MLPDFRENYLIAHAALRPGISLQETSRVGQRIATRLAAIPGVKSVAEQIGRAENGQDPDAPNKSEFEIQLDPAQALTTAQLESKVRAVFDAFPNQLVEIYSVLAERIGETLSGEVAPFFVSVFGPDLDVDDEVAGQIAAVLRQWPQSGTVRLQVPPRQPELQVQLRPEQLALYGLQATEVLSALNADYHGTVVAQLNQSDRSVPVVVRLRGAGTTPEDVGTLALRGHDGVRVPLAAVATLSMVSARSLVEHEDGLRRQVVVASPHTADQAGFARAAQAAIAAHVKLPPNVYLRYGGTAPAQAAAARELMLALGRRARPHCAAAGARLRGEPARAPGARDTAEHAHRRGGRGGAQRRHALTRCHGRLRRALWHGGAQYHPPDLPLRASRHHRR